MKDRKPPRAIAPSRVLAEARREAVLERKDECLELYMNGHSFEQIVAMLNIAESPNYTRFILYTYAYKEYCAATKARSHSLVEKAVDVARQSIAIGDSAGYRVATDVFLKVAAKLNREEYGDKASMEVTGAGGGPIQTEAEITLTAAEAYERLIKGK
jgi:hypothetical protein